MAAISTLDVCEFLDQVEYNRIYNEMEDSVQRDYESLEPDTTDGFTVRKIEEFTEIKKCNVENVFNQEITSLDIIQRKVAF